MGIISKFTINGVNVRGWELDRIKDINGNMYAESAIDETGKQYWKPIDVIPAAYKRVKSLNSDGNQFITVDINNATRMQDNSLEYTAPQPRLFQNEKTKHLSVKGILGERIYKIVTNKGGEVNLIDPLLAFKPDVPDIPDDYVLLEYLTTNGNQYADLRITGDQNTSYEIKAKSNVANSTNLFGARVSATSNNISIMLASSGNINVDFGDYTNTRIASIIGNNVFTVYSSKSLRRLVYNGNEIKNDYVYPLDFKTNSLWLFWLNGNRNVSGKWNGDFYYLKLWDGGTLVKHIVPVIRKSDNLVGLFDVVSQTLLQNIGSGTYTAGPAVESDTAYDVLSSNGNITRNCGLDSEGNVYKLDTPIIEPFDNTPLLGDITITNVPYELYYDPIKQWIAKYYDNKKAIRNYIPVLRIEDNKPGMYEVATDEFKVNEGTGEFTVTM